VHCSVCDSGIPRKWQYVSIKFCFKLGKNAAENSKMSQLACTEHEMGRRQVLLNSFPKSESDVTPADDA
jgi:hypothetical protein